MGETTRGEMEDDDSDPELLEAVRRGERHAYVTLYERHVDTARGLARALLRNQADADDVVSEVFVSVLSVIAGGKGPRDGFRSYLMASVRNECYRFGRRRGRIIPVAATSEPFAASNDRAVDPFADRDEIDVLQQAFQSLPPTFREVLWRTEVEGRTHQEIADVTGSTAQAVAAQAMRARRALGGAYLQHHLPDESVAATVSPACSDTRRELAAFVRDSVSARARRRLDSHLTSCASCRDARDELERVNQHLRTAPGLPFAAGAGILQVGLKARVIGWLAASTAPVVAATGLVAVSIAVSLAVAGRTGGGDHVVAATAPAAPRQTPALAPAPAPQASSDDSPGRPATTPAPTSTSAPRAAPPKNPPRPGPKRGSGDPGGRSSTTVTVEPGPASPTTSAPGPAAPPLGEPPPDEPPPGEPPAATVLPAVTVLPPVTVVPPVTVLPPITIPGATNPPVSLPPVTVPPVTVPPVTVPPVNVAALTLPTVTGSSVSLPPIGG